MRKNILIWIVAGFAILGFALLFFPSGKAPLKEEKNLPWQIDAEAAEQTTVFSLNIGTDSLAAVTEGIRKIPEVAAFQDPGGAYIIEAYFPRAEIGLLQGSMAAEVDLKEVSLEGYAKFDKPGKPMPSGMRKFALSKSGIIGANQLRVWKLAYLPSADYEPELISHFFGEPEYKEAIAEALETWFYPEKGLIIAYNKQGQEVFYYSARKEFSRLRDSVVSQYSKKEHNND